MKKQITQLQLFFLGQLLCLCSTAGGAILQVQNNIYNANLSFITLGMYYLFQIIQFVFPANRGKYGKKVFLKALMSGLIDCGANACNVYAYVYSDVASINLLLSLVVPACMVSNFLVNKQRFEYKQVALGLGTVVLGVCYSTLSARFAAASNKALGNFLACAAALGYAFSGTVNEKFSRGVPPGAYLSRSAVSGVIFSLIMMISTEIPTYKQVSWQPIVLCIPYGLIQQAFYYLALTLVQHTNAVYFNLTTMCVTFYSFILSIVAFKVEYKFIQIIPIAGVVVCVIIFSINELAQYSIMSQKLANKHNEQNEINSQSGLKASEVA